MGERRTFRGLPVAGVAAACVVLGHWLAYAIAIPRPALRAEFLLDSGHSYWSTAVKLAVLLAISGLGALTMRHLWGSVRPQPSAGGTLSWLALRLALLQVVAFSAMEVCERMMSGAPVAPMFQHQVFLFGVLVQLLLAGAGAALLYWFGRTVARLAAALLGSNLRRSPASSIRPRTAPVRPVLVFQGASGVRGPPSL